jgi:hypothetical protein
MAIQENGLPTGLHGRLVLEARIERLEKAVELERAVRREIVNRLERLDAAGDPTDDDAA